MHIQANFLQFALFLLESFALGALFGAERQSRNRTAGLRTNTLVAVGAAGFALIGQMTLGGDSIRIAAQVVSGIGFLGAGVILREGLSIKGLSPKYTRQEDIFWRHFRIENTPKMVEMALFMPF